MLIIICMFIFYLSIVMGAMVQYDSLKRFNGNCNVKIHMFGFPFYFFYLYILIKRGKYKFK